VRGLSTGKISSRNTPLEQLRVNLKSDAQQEQREHGSWQGNSDAQTGLLRTKGRVACRIRREDSIPEWKTV